MKVLRSICIFCLVMPLFSQQDILQEKSMVINIEVPVRVFEGGIFVNNLTINDFEIYEEGVSQKIEAVYLINKDAVQRKEEKKEFTPQTGRTFFLFFEVSEYDSRLGDGVDYFVQNVLLPRDNLIAVTPMKTYRLKDKGLEIKTKQEISAELKNLIRKDAVLGDSEYRNALKEIEDVAKALSQGPPSQGRPLGQSLQSTTILVPSDIEPLLEAYRLALQRLEFMRDLDQLRLLEFADILKNREGQQYVYIFYQNEFVPLLEDFVLERLTSIYQNEGHILLMLQELFVLNKRDVTVDLDKVKKRFADASTSIHFLYISRTPEPVVGIRFEEHSEDIFAPFIEIAQASGGFVESSADPDFLFKKAVAASENYYLLYYAPKEYAGDEKFKEIKVRVKGNGYKVIHRLGYFSN